MCLFRLTLVVRNVFKAILLLILIVLIAKSGIQPPDLIPLTVFIIQQCPYLKFKGLMTIGSPEPLLDPKYNPDFAVPHLYI